MTCAISIAMATYNGAAFLEEQLASLAAQQPEPAELVVCDDGSTDDTIAILERFASRASFPVHIHRNERNLGYVENFLKAAQLCRGDWISFCDQDDVWLPDNLASVARAIGATPGAALVGHKAAVVDRNLAPLGYEVPRLMPARRVIEPLEQPLWFRLPGFCCTVEASLIRDFPHDDRPLSFTYPPVTQSADKRAVWLGNIFGRTLLIHESKTLYRRHEENVTALARTRARGLKISGRGDEHGFNAARARSAESYVREIARLRAFAKDEDKRRRLDAAAVYYARIARLFRLRAALSSLPPGKRIAGLLRLAAGGMYGRAGLGPRSAIRDLLTVFLPARGAPETGS
ncbi:MAG: glycosyltransferase [Sphingomonadaceae bacterium]